jgi:hypothetical protein
MYPSLKDNNTNGSRHRQAQKIRADKVEEGCERNSFQKRDEETLSMNGSF